LTHTHTHTHTHTTHTHHTHTHTNIHIIPIMKPGKEGLSEVHKYRPISLLNTGGKLLEKLLIERINYHLYSNNLLNNNQFGFTPQKSTVDAALA
jgi:hypothetical protein